MPLDPEREDDEVRENIEPVEATVTININGDEIYRKFQFIKGEDSPEYVKERLSEIAYEIADSLL